MPNIRILAKAVPRLFCSQSYSYKKCLCPKKESNSTENLRNRLKVNLVIYTLVCNYLLNIRILALAVLQIFCSQGCSYTKCLCLKKENHSSKNFGICSKFNQFIYTLVCTYMPNIRILAIAVLQIFCSQGCSYTKCLCPKRGITQPKIYGICSKVNQFIYLVCNYMPNIRILALAVPQIFCSQGCSYIVQKGA